MKLGVALLLIDVAVGGDPSAIREFAQVAEVIGYQDLSAPDHVLGVNAASRPVGAIATHQRICFMIRWCCSAFSPAAPRRLSSPPRC
jgi:hypothetical protein